VGYVVFCLFVCLFCFVLFVCLFVCFVLFVCLFVCFVLFVCLFVCLFSCDTIKCNWNQRSLIPMQVLLSKHENIAVSFDSYTEEPGDKARIKKCLH